jgi:uncharacterized protein (DUF302 family)
MKKIVIMIIALSLSLFADSVYSKTYNSSMDNVYPKILKSFDNAHLIVVSEINILEKFKGAGLPKKFGKNFNTNNLTGIKAIIACNGWFGNEVANADPKMMAFCPIRITVIEQDGKTSIMYVRPNVSNNESKASGILEKLEQKVIKAIENI